MTAPLTYHTYDGFNCRSQQVDSIYSLAVHEEQGVFHIAMVGANTDGVATRRWCLIDVWGTPPDSGTVFVASIPAIMISGLDSSTHYSAYICSVCMHDSLVYSDWSEPLDIYICDTGGTIAIETPLLEQLTYLRPNPASRQVQVLSSYGMTRVEAYNLQGKRMTDVNVKGLGTTLDVSDWSAGMYVVVVHTPAGNATKKLVVGR